MIFLYGGANESGPLGDLWRYDLGTMHSNLEALKNGIR